MELIKDFSINVGGYTIAPGAMANSPERIYIPVNNQDEEKAQMIVYNYGGNNVNKEGSRLLSEEFKLPFTRGTIFGGATWYNDEIWVVTDEQTENKFIGCVERYSTSGVKSQGFGLPWMWGYELFEPLGISINQNLFYILTKRTGWFDNEYIKDSYQIEIYNAEGHFQSLFKLYEGEILDGAGNEILDGGGNLILDQKNSNPVGLTDDGLLFYVGDIEENLSFYYNRTFLFENNDFPFEDDNKNIHGIGYNGASFSVLRYKDSSDEINPHIFIYGDGNVLPDSDDEDLPYHTASIVTKLNKQFGNIGRYGRSFSVVKVNENGIDYTERNWKLFPGTSSEKIIKDMSFYFGPASSSFTATNLEQNLFGTLDFFKFIPQRTLYGLRKGDILVDFSPENNKKSDSDNQSKPLPELRFEIVGFRESANGQTQTIYVKRLG